MNCAGPVGARSESMNFEVGFACSICSVHRSYVLGKGHGY